MMIPIQAVLIPLSYIFGKLGIMNNYPVLILLYAAFCFPMTILILTGFMNGIPTELEEAMVIDGANIYQVFFKMILPLSVPGIVSVSIFNFIQVWNNLLFPLILFLIKIKVLFLWDFLHSLENTVQIIVPAWQEFVLQPFR